MSTSEDGLEIRGLRVVDNLDSRWWKAWRRIAPYVYISSAQVVIPTQPHWFTLKIVDGNGKVLATRTFQKQEQIESARLATVQALGALPSGEVTTTTLQAIVDGRPFNP